MAAHVFALVDRNNFFVSRERADRLMIARDLINARGQTACERRSPRRTTRRDELLTL
ncbi:MAG TPA: hypothetical protein VK388_10685 [Pyrinomonadaceae bacterium]|nr:hypothetical protein [Pyrinomonadaceae bacterium]